MNCSNCNLPLPGAGLVRSCPRCFTVTEALQLADTEPPPDSGPEIVIHDDGTPKPWHPFVRRIMEAGGA